MATITSPMRKTSVATTIAIATRITTTSAKFNSKSLGSRSMIHSRNCYRSTLFQYGGIRHLLQLTSMGNNGRPYAQPQIVISERDPLHFSNEFAEGCDQVIESFKGIKGFEQISGELALSITNLAASPTQREDTDNTQLAELAGKYYCDLKDNETDDEKYAYTRYLSRLDTKPEDFLIPDRVKKLSKPIKKKQEHNEPPPLFHNLPIHSKYREIMSSITNNPVTIITAETGSGKSTQVPLYIWEHYNLGKRLLESNSKVDNKRYSKHVFSSTPPRILVTQPRRLAAISIASTISTGLDEVLGDSIGYSMRQDEILPTNPSGQILFSTAGSVLAHVSRSVDLPGLTHIIVDEVHERDMETEILLSACKLLMRSNPELRIILMSATANTSYLQEYFKGCGATNAFEDDPLPPVIAIEGRRFDVETMFLDNILNANNGKWPKLRRQENIEDWNLIVKRKGTPLDIPPIFPYEILVYIVSCICKATPENESILVFLPGFKEINELYKDMVVYDLAKVGFSNTSKFEFHILHSHISSIKQRAAMRPRRPNGPRKIILSTNLAEVSLTIPDVVHVVDSAQRRHREYRSNQSCSFLTTKFITFSNMIQRQGRTGRSQPGKYYTLLPKWLFVENKKERCGYSLNPKYPGIIEKDEISGLCTRELSEIVLNLLTVRSLGEVFNLLIGAPSQPGVDQIVHAVKTISRHGLLADNSISSFGKLTTDDLKALRLSSTANMLTSAVVPPWLISAFIEGSRFGLMRDVLKIAVLSDDSQLTSQLAERNANDNSNNSAHTLFGNSRYNQHVQVEKNKNDVVPKVEQNSKPLETEGGVNQGSSLQQDGDLPYFMYLPEVPSDLLAALVAFNGFFAARNKTEFCKKYHLSRKFLESRGRSFSILEGRLLLPDKAEDMANLGHYETMWKKYFSRRVDKREKPVPNIDSGKENAMPLVRQTPTESVKHAIQIPSMGNELLEGKNREILLRAILSAKMFPNWAQLGKSFRSVSKMSQMPVYYRYGSDAGKDEIETTVDVMVAPESSLNFSFIKSRRMPLPSYISFSYLSKENEEEHHAIARNVSRANPLSLVFFSDLPLIIDRQKCSIIILTSEKLFMRSLDPEEIKNQFANTSKQLARLTRTKKGRQFDVSDVINKSIYQVYCRYRRSHTDEISIEFKNLVDLDRIAELARLCRRHMNLYKVHLQSSSSMNSEIKPNLCPGLDEKTELALLEYVVRALIDSEDTDPKITLLSTTRKQRIGSSNTEAH